MAADPHEIEAIVSAVLARLDVPAVSPRDRGSATARDAPSHGLFADLDAAVQAARRAHLAIRECSLADRRKWIDALREVGRREAKTVARMAVEETHLGRIDDKILKNLLVAEKTPGTEDLTASAFTGDDGLTLEELAPWGVIAAITPCTNPTETILCNGIGMLAAGNSVVFCPHPLARRVSAHMITAMNAAITAAGGPTPVFCALSEPSIEMAQALMKHPGAPLVVVTGGPDVVREAMRTGKRVIAAGPGNPPALVDDTADLERAGRDVVLGASLDNNIICSDEKEVIVLSSVADRLKASMAAEGGHEVVGPQIERLAALVLSPSESRGRDRREVRVNRDWIGQDAQRIAEAIGLRPSREIRLLFAEVDRDHPFVWTELLMPVLPVVRVRSFEDGMELALAAEKGCRHTAVMHGRDIERLSRMARRVDCSIFVKNAPSYAGLGMGGEGSTSFTIAGPTGEGMTSARHFARRRRCTLSGAFRIV